MKHRVLLLLALGCVNVLHAAPVEKDGLEPGSCEDAFALSAAEQALTKINRDRQEGYIFSLHRLSNVHIGKHGETGFVFYLTLDIVETECSVLSGKEWKSCEARPDYNTPVYGQCKAIIYINKPNRVVRLIKYNCDARPAPTAKIISTCPDCNVLSDVNDDNIQNTVATTLKKFNNESKLKNHFTLLKVNRATTGMGMVTFYNTEYTIQETACSKDIEEVTAEKCPPMSCEFAHKGFCKGSHIIPSTQESEFTVECEIYEPEAAEREKKLHLLGGEQDHSHNDSHTHGHAHDHDSHVPDDKHSHHHAHDHVHDHTKSHADHDKTHQHADNSQHHHTHDHDAGSTHRHAHAHSHDHGHGHDHVHAHHAKAHDHSGDSPNHHHDYKHADSQFTHEHDHELALDHNHKHAHLHEHEHHHHHHDHNHETDYHDHPHGRVTILPAVDQPMTLPFFPEFPDHGIILPAVPDPQIPGEMKPTILGFPTSVSAQCPKPPSTGTLVEELFKDDPKFAAAA